MVVDLFVCVILNEIENAARPPREQLEDRRGVQHAISAGVRISKYYSTLAVTQNSV